MSSYPPGSAYSSEDDCPPQQLSSFGNRYGTAPTCPAATHQREKPRKKQPSPPPAAAYPPPLANAFASLVPSEFPPGTDPQIVSCFHLADKDASGFVDDKELQKALSSCNQPFSLRTVRLLMYQFTNSNVRKIGPNEFIALYQSLQKWRATFEKFDKDRSWKIDASELKAALLSLGYTVSPAILNLLIIKYDKNGKTKAINYDGFIECILIVKGLTKKFKAKDTACVGSVTFTYEDFLLTVLPFLVA